jgi:hypothetical protein
MADIEIKNGKIYIDGKRATEKEAEAKISKDNKITGGFINFGTVNGKKD